MFGEVEVELEVEDKFHVEPFRIMRMLTDVFSHYLES